MCFSTCLKIHLVQTHYRYSTLQIQHTKDKCTDTLQIQHTTDTAQAQIQHTKAWEQKSGIRIASQLGTSNPNCGMKSQERGGAGPR